MDILYIIGKGRSLCNHFELRCSLRSLERYGKNIGKIYVAGYCPEWLSDEVVKIPFEQPYQEENITPHHKACNIAATLLYAIDNSEIGNDFLVSMDDHIYTRNVDFSKYPAYVAIKSYGEGEDKALLPSHKEKESKYKAFLADTREILESMNMPSYCFPLHRNMHMSREFLNTYRETINSMIEEGIIAEIFAFYGNSKMAEKTYEIVKVKDVLVHGGSEWWKTDSRETEVFSVCDFCEDSGLHVLLSGMFEDKCKYEKEVENGK